MTNFGFEQFAVDNPGVDEVDGLTVTLDGEPIRYFVYARHGGLLTLTYFITDGFGETWPTDQVHDAIDVAFGKLIDAGPISPPVPSASESIIIAAEEIPDPPYAETDTTSCAKPSPPTAVAVNPIDLPPASEEALRWTIPATESSHNVVPNDSAEGATAYGVDGTLHLADDAGQDRWTWSALRILDVDVADSVYVLGEDHQKQVLAALDPATGEPRWVDGLSAMAKFEFEPRVSIEAMGPTVRRVRQLRDRHARDERRHRERCSSPTSGLSQPTWPTRPPHSPASASTSSSPPRGRTPSSTSSARSGPSWCCSRIGRNDRHGLSTFEIGDESVAIDSFTTAVRQAATPPDLVMVLSDSSSTAEVEATAYELLAGGCSACISNVGTIGAGHAFRGISELIRQLATTTGSLGAAVLGARRRLLLDTNPLALSIVVFGDIDFSIDRPPLSGSAS